MEFLFILKEAKTGDEMDDDELINKQAVVLSNRGERR